MDFLVHPTIGPLKGDLKVPSDKSIGHRAVILAALADGVSTIDNFSFGADNVSTLHCFEEMGVCHELHGDSSLLVHGVGLHGLRQPSKPLDCGNSGTTMRLLSGVLAAQNFGAQMIGDASLSRRPMRRVLDPLRAAGARCKGTPHPEKQDETAPLIFDGMPVNQNLNALTLDLKIASAQVKSAVLFAGLYADGPTRVREPMLSRDHTERMFESAKIPIARDGDWIVLDTAGWNHRIEPFSIIVPGDVSAAAFAFVAASIFGGSDVHIHGVGVNPTRTGIIDILRHMKAQIDLQACEMGSREPTADVRVQSSELVAGDFGGEWVTRAIDEIPVLCVAAARAHGVTTIRDASELRVKESDRIAMMVRVLRAFGIEARELPDGLAIEGQPLKPLQAADISSAGDHRIAMSAVLLAMAADGRSRIRDVDCVATSFPSFAEKLNALGANISLTASGC